MISNAEFEALQVKKETPQGIEWISDALEAIEKEAGQNMPSGKTADFLFHLVKRALIEIGTVQAQRIAGNYEKSPTTIIPNHSLKSSQSVGNAASFSVESCGW